MKILNFLFILVIKKNIFEDENLKFSFYIILFISLSQRGQFLNIFEKNLWFTSYITFYIAERKF